MQTEIEAKFLEIDHAALRTKLTELGAECVYESRMFKRRNFDFPDMRLDKKQAWIRLRDEGDKVELMIKQKVGDKLGDIRETAVLVNDFEAATEFLFGLEMIQKTEQESKRELWHYKDAEIMLDEWPWAKPFAEVEAETAEAVESVARELGLDWTQAIFDTVEPVYYNQYRVTREQIHAVKQFKFGAHVPETFKPKAQT